MSIPTTPRRQDEIPSLTPEAFERWTRPLLLVSGEGVQRLSRSLSSVG